ncbi:MAG: DUF192 domain-containing protein [Bacteriovoracaceae bacterium]
MTKFLTLCLLFILFSCQSESRKNSKEVDLITPKGKAVRTRLSVTMKEQEQGLSGIQAGDFDDDQGMLFYYLEDGDKYFWMPDTYFDLDLFYLDKDLRVKDIVRKLPHHIGRHNEDLIPRARGVWCRHVLEMKTSSPIAAEIQIGDQLTWKGVVPLSEMDVKARELLKQ